MSKLLLAQKNIFCNILFWCSVFLLVSCRNYLTFEEKSSRAYSFAIKNKFILQLVKTDTFTLTTFQRITDIKKPYVFYIEGDGEIIFQNRIASNPTPSNIMLLELAALDERENIIYIARPCQYTPPILNKNCKQEFWLNKRLSEEIIESINSAINKISNRKPIHLIGFSGGGAAAVLVAARNTNVVDIVTLAGNLNTELFSEYHGIFALKQSLNPINYAIKISSVPQLHLIGDSDIIVPYVIIRSYIEKSQSKCVFYKKLKNVTHNKGWKNSWNDIIKIKLLCK